MKTLTLTVSRPMTRTPEQDEARRVWRSRIPFTDAEIARALAELAQTDEDAGRIAGARRLRRRCGAVMRGRMCRDDYAKALPVLVRTCDVETDGVTCGKPAAYRINYHGRCSEHRKVSTPGMDFVRALYAHKGAECERIRKENDAVTLSEEHAKSMATHHGRRGYR